MYEPKYSNTTVKPILAMPHFDIGMTDNKDIEELLMQNDIFDKKGEPILEPYKKKIKTKLSIDFFEASVKIYIFFPKVRKKDSLKTKDSEMNKLLDTQKNQRIVYKKFKISDDYSSVRIDDFVYTIPVFFNREMLKKEDLKTLEMVFYQIFSNEVNQALKQYKSPAKEQNSES